VQQGLAKPPFGHQTARTDRHCASEKQPAKAYHLSVACFESSSLLMYHSVHDEKSNLLTWAIRLIFSEPITNKAVTSSYITKIHKATRTTINILANYII